MRAGRFARAQGAAESALRLAGNDHPTERGRAERAIGIALGTYRIVTGAPIHYFIIAGYLLVIVQTWFAPKQIVPLAYDSGGVTTSTVTVPLVTALGVGLASSIEGRNPMADGFGLIAFASLTPILFVMAYGILI